MKALAWLLAGGGLLLLVSGIKGHDPRTVIVDTVTGKSTTPVPFASTPAGSKMSATPGQNLGSPVAGALGSIGVQQVYPS